MLVVPREKMEKSSVIATIKKTIIQTVPQSLLDVTRLALLEVNLKVLERFALVSANQEGHHLSVQTCALQAPVKKISSVLWLERNKNAYVKTSNLFL